MPRIVVVWIALSSAAIAFAAENWNGPGWYRTLEMPGGAAVEAGPFSDEESCRATLPTDEHRRQYSFCRYFETNPPDYE
jgi:hypothetical protein